MFSKRHRHVLHKPATTLLLGSYGRGNSGDDVFLLAAASLLREHKLCINSADDTLLPISLRGHIVTLSTTSSKDWIKKIKFFWMVHTIIYWGGDVWVELYGNRWPRQSLYKMIGLNILARLTGKRIYYVGCGIGDLRGYSLFLARQSARLSHAIATRESRSARVLGLRKIKVLPDLAINLPYYQPRLHRIAQPFTIGISLLYYVPRPEYNFKKLITALSALIVSLQKDTFKVVLLPMFANERDQHDDLWAAEQLRVELARHGVVSELCLPETLEEYVEKLGSFHLVIGARLHANILATFNATPCLGIAYRPKVASFFADNGLDRYCISIDSLDQLDETFWYIYRNYTAVAKQFLRASKQNLKQQSAYRQFAEGNHNFKEELSYQDLTAECD